MTRNESILRSVSQCFQEAIREVNVSTNCTYVRGWKRVLDILFGIAHVPSASRASHSKAVVSYLLRHSTLCQIQFCASQSSKKLLRRSCLVRNH